MRLKDLNTTTEYAYRWGKYGSAQKVRVRDTEKYYTYASYRDRTIKPAHPSEKPTTGGSGYFSTPVGVLVQPSDPTATPQIAYPAHILSTWTDYEIKEAAEKEHRRKQQQIEDEKARKNKRDAARLRELLANHPEIRSPYISDYKSSTEISYPVLIQLLEALPDADN